MKDLIIITARKDSKRLINKNLTKIGKKNLIERSIEFALKISEKNYIYLSTDSKKIKDYSKKYNIFCPVNLRPKFLSSAKASSSDVCIHAIKNFEKITGNQISNIILLQPTSPFRTVQYYKQTYDIFKKNKKPTITVSPIMDKKYIQANKNKIIFLRNKKKNFYEINGNLYIIKSSDLFKTKSFFKKDFNISITKSKKLSVDIDTIYDLDIAKSFLK